MENVHPLRAYRETREPPLSQKALAELLGVDRVTVARWETRKRRVDEDRLLFIAEKTGIGPAELRPDLAALFNSCA